MYESASSAISRYRRNINEKRRVFLYLLGVRCFESIRLHTRREYYAVFPDFIDPLARVRAAPRNLEFAGCYSALNLKSNDGKSHKTGRDKSAAAAAVWDH